MARADNNRWRVMRPQRLRVRRWEDEVVVYDDRTGDTHILEDLAGRVLERLMHASASTDELTQTWLASTAGSQDDSALRERGVTHIHAVLERLRSKGIVKPVLK